MDRHLKPLEKLGPTFPFIASLVLAGCILILLALVIWLIIRMRKLQRELERIREDRANEPTYTNPGPAPKNANPRPKNEYTPNPQIKTPEPKRQSFQRRDSSESVTYVPSRRPSLRSINQSHALPSVLGATSDQLSSSAAVIVHCEPRAEVQIEMEELYENRETIQLNRDNGETSTDAREAHELFSQQSRDEHAFANEGFDFEDIAEPIYQNRGELAAVHNPQLELITDSTQVQSDWAV